MQHFIVLELIYEKNKIMNSRIVGAMQAVHL